METIRLLLSIQAEAIKRLRSRVFGNFPSPRVSRSRLVVFSRPRIHTQYTREWPLYNLQMGLLQRATSWYYARSVQNLAPGDVCSIKSEDRFSVAKVLAKSGDVVHVRIYKEKFAIRPQLLEMRALSLGSIDDPDGFGVGHVPLSCARFGSWLPARFRSDPVTDDEFVWVTEWERSGGDVWS